MTDKVAIVTAASRGMGAACARELAQRGYKLAILARSDGIRDLASELGAIAVQGDVTRPDDLERLVTISMESYGRIDGVVNSGGYAAKGNLLEISDQDWHQAVDLLLLNVVRLSRLVTPIMEKQGGGSIVNITTLAAKEPDATYALSAAIRSGTSVFTKMFATQYAGKNIRMNCVLPGLFDSFAADEATLASLPMGRAGTVAEMAKTVAFLLSADAGYLTGQSITVDGGYGSTF
jgi:NAD(P)-dependent dehydrogenase (short-subunit alcohol dehydrogenase family)